ncbi:hypothetical protein NEOLEDRAFT_1136757 [Neolentinus lepideus HHB14362 ss-1]|uniref:Uncharacterized protein n=1 Tax=Neolentinus lepideus HHB14362 ss-1 TaxID=1314782 RepID=A0A165R6D0_9AGAM|nr:hypothetical protein NEOLEDRAFT_1136757 [Neolentinus lepideus HHB14362 ss-1]
MGLHDLKKLLDRGIDRLTSTELLGCTIHTLSPSCIRLTLTPEAVSTDVSTQAMGISATFNFGYDEEYLILDLIKKYFRLVLCPVEYLSIQDGRTYTEHVIMSWRELYLSMPNVKRLHLSGSSTSTLPTGLVFPDKVGRSWYWPTLFPILESLELESIWFRESSHPLHPDEGNFLDRILIPFLRRSEFEGNMSDAVEAPISPYQRRIDYKIKDLTITKGINIWKDDIEFLRKLFLVIIWDESELEKHQESACYEYDDEEYDSLDEDDNYLDGYSGSDADDEESPDEQDESSQD